MAPQARVVPGRFAAAVTVLATFACGGDGPTTPVSESPDLSCSIPESRIFNGQVKDGIPALTDPARVAVSSPDAQYLKPGDRVIGLRTGGTFLAVPLNILWWHEIVNVDVDGRRLAITHCPLTGSSLAFDRAAAGGAEFGVSGLLYQNNLIMYDRTTDQSLWPQMVRGARCGSQDGTPLSMVAVVEMTWQGWLTLHPGTEVIGSATGFERDYEVYPYGDYDRVDNPELLFPQPDLDRRRPPKERVLGIPDGSGGGVAYPFGELAEVGLAAAVAASDHVVFWDGNREGAMAYRPEVDGQALRFGVVGDVIRDEQTGSTWTLDGMAVDGPLAGRSLSPVAEAYVAFWFAWAAFQPGAALWEAP